MSCHVVIPLMKKHKSVICVFGGQILIHSINMGYVDLVKIEKHGNEKDVDGKYNYDNNLCV